MPLVYATVDDLFVFSSTFDPPDDQDLDADLRDASLSVRQATRAAVYDTLPSGLPRNDDLTEALRDATCAQVVFWVGARLNRTAAQAGTDQVVQSKSMGGRAVTYKDSSATQVAASVTLCSNALAILADAGLVSAGVWGY